LEEYNKTSHAEDVFRQAVTAFSLIQAPRNVRDVKKQTDNATGTWMGQTNPRHDEEEDKRQGMKNSDSYQSLVIINVTDAQQK
jgi:hypothetical protein